ncbi:DNA/RNA nuclease SfsA [Tepidibacillus sp. LV47]|uniref:DNA/RNA nuclease SfsA n=1 Tax=Tepidibacillus sp. LV47 TaxID=3398228 RepID=UPI003AAFAEA0
MKTFNAISIPFSVPLQKARFIERPNRFLVRCKLENNGEVVEAHLADPGRMKELLVPGLVIWIRPESKPKRKTNWTAVLCQTNDRDGFVSLDSFLPNQLIGKALAKKAIEELNEWTLVRPEFKMGDSRWDFLLEKENGKKLIVEVKSVTLVENGIGLFPDAVTKRGARHVNELSHIASSMPDYEAAILFVAQREDIIQIQPARSIDPIFADALDTAKKSGVKILGRKCHITLDGITLGEPVFVYI